MTYSSNLDPNLPGQGEFAKLGAGRIRALTLALKERLASVFTDPNADPLVFKPLSITLASVKQEIYEFPFVVSTLLTSGGGKTTAVTANPAAIGTPCFPYWKVFSPADSALSDLTVNAHLDGTSLKWSIRNNSTGAIDLNGSVLAVLILHTA